MSARRPKAYRKSTMTSLVNSWSTCRAVTRKWRQDDRKVMSQARPGHSDFKRKARLYRDPSDRRHVLGCEADRIRWPESSRNTPEGGH